MEEGSHLDPKMLTVVELVVSPPDHRTPTVVELVVSPPDYRTPMVVESVASPPDHRTPTLEAMADGHLGPMMLMDLGDR